MSEPVDLDTYFNALVSAQNAKVLAEHYDWLLGHHMGNGTGPLITALPVDDKTFHPAYLKVFEPARKAVETIRDEMARDALDLELDTTHLSTLIEHPERRTTEGLTKLQNFAARIGVLDDIRKKAERDMVAIVPSFSQGLTAK